MELRASTTNHSREVGKLRGWCHWTGHALTSYAGIVPLSETLSQVHLPTFGKFACLQTVGEDLIFVFASFLKFCLKLRAGSLAPGEKPKLTKEGLSLFHG